VLPLQDAIYFAVARQRSSAGRLSPPFHLVRVWGSIGFIVPSVLLYMLLRQGLPVAVVLPVATTVGLIGLLNTFLLPDPRIRLQPKPEEALPAESRLPTFAALRALREPHVLVFCIGMGMVHVASAVDYGFYPIYLTELIGIDPRWVGLIAGAGVTVEIGFMLSFGWLMRRLGLKWLVALGIAAMAGRFLLLAALPTVWVAVGVQAMHGLSVLVMHVAPPLFLNRHAEDRFRNSMQGLYTMVVVGLGRILGSVVGGYLAGYHLLGTFAGCGLLCVLATALFIFAFHERRGAALAVTSEASR
jgi:MFS transporter, PPP family, 3-phenylpropionic acid transporter